VKKDGNKSHTYISPQIPSEKQDGTKSNQEKEQERSSEEKKGGKESGGKGDKWENRIQNKKERCVYLSCSLNGSLPKPNSTRVPKYHRREKLRGMKPNKVKEKEYRKKQKQTKKW